MDNGQTGNGLHVVQLAITLTDLAVKLEAGLVQILRRNMVEALAKALQHKHKGPAIRYRIAAQVLYKLAI